MSYDRFKGFVPDYRNILNAANNIESDRLPLYEHIISEETMEAVLEKKFSHLKKGDESDLREYYTNYTQFFKTVGYDTISYEECICSILPGGGALGGHRKGIIQNREDFEKYPWDSLKDIYFETNTPRFDMLRQVMPEGMKAIGGPGNGVFEIVQDLVGYEDLCMLKYDDPDLYGDLFRKVGDTMVAIWTEFLSTYSDLYTVVRFGDDLGFKSSTLLPPDDIREHIIPQYKRIVDLVHKSNMPFLLHSCGNIFNVMDDIIEVAGINAKHSNEDGIAPFPHWVEKYGDKIGNFGGVDTDVLCLKSPEEIKKYILDVIEKSAGKGGFALGSGNSIPAYVPVEGFLAMVETVADYRENK